VASAEYGDYSSRFMFEESLQEQVSGLYGMPRIGYVSNYTNAQIDKGLIFNGAGYYINMSKTFGDFQTEDFTLSAWVYINGTASASDNYIIHKRLTDAFSPYSSYGLLIRNGNFTFSTINIGFSEVYGYPVPLHKWVHIIGVRNSTHVTLYFNGIMNRSTAGTLRNVSNNGTWTIGSASPASMIGNFFNGSIDDVRIYNRALTQADTLNLFNEGYARNGDLNYSNIACLGDSITGEWLSDSYCTKLADIPLIDTFNYGVSGDTLEVIKDRFIINVTNKKYNKTIILSGTNDRLKTTTRNYLDFYNNLTFIVQTIKNDNQSILISTIPPANGSQEAVEGAEIQSYTKGINNIIRRVSYDTNTCYSDIFTDVFKGAFNLSQFRDYLHPTALTQSKMNSSFYRDFTTCVPFNCSASPSQCYNFQTDITPPTVTLVSPTNNTISTSTSVNLVYTYNNANSGNCSLTINNNQVSNLTGIAVGETKTVSISAPIGSYLWKVNCTDSDWNTALSQEWGFSVTTSSVVTNQGVKDNITNSYLLIAQLAGLIIIVAIIIGIVFIVKSFQNGAIDFNNAFAWIASGLFILIMLTVLILIIVAILNSFTGIAIG
jgi:lysophospholipase L1-like esterase